MNWHVMFLVRFARAKSRAFFCCSSSNQESRALGSLLQNAPRDPLYALRKSTHSPNHACPFSTAGLFIDILTLQVAIRGLSANLSIGVYQ